MKLIETTELEKGNLYICQNVWDTGTEIVRENHVMYNHGKYTEELEPTDPRYNEMIIALHNHKIETNKY